jgi:phosphatidylserine decarboxylase precursor-related protein
VIDVGEVEGADGVKRLRIGIFLSVFNVHVNRSPLAGRVVAIERSGSKYLAAFNREAENANVRCSMTLETATGERFEVAQITGLIARRILCFPQIGDWVARGDRYGYIRSASGSTASTASAPSAPRTAATRSTRRASSPMAARSTARSSSPSCSPAIRASTAA